MIPVKRCKNPECNKPLRDFNKSGYCSNCSSFLGSKFGKFYDAIMIQVNKEVTEEDLQRNMQLLKEGQPLDIPLSRMEKLKHRWTSYVVNHLLPDQIDKKIKYIENRKKLIEKSEAKQKHLNNKETLK